MIKNKPVLSYPVDLNIPISQVFWERHPDDPYYEWAYALFDGHHPGLDFSMEEGKDVHSAFEGIVVRKEFHKGMGLTLGIRNGNIVAIYGHLKKFAVELGQVVHTKEIIAISGNTGEATKPNNPHLHFELRDITEPSLPKMVFEPKFDKPIKEWEDKFTYIVNSTNTIKSLASLALLYFGSGDRWEKIRNENQHISQHLKTQTLSNDLVVAIPNY